MTKDKRNFIWNLIGLTFNCFNSFFFLVVVNRINGSEKAGVFTFGYAIACLLWVISMYFTRVYQISNKDVSNIDYIKSRFIFCILMLLISLFISAFYISNFFKFLVIVLLCLFRNIEAFADSFYGIIHKNNDLDYVGKSLFLKAVIGLLLFTIIDFFTKNVLLSVVFLIIVNLVGTFIDYLYCKKYIIKNKFSICVFNKLLIDAFPIFLFSFLMVFLLNCQKYIIGIIISDEKIQTIFGIVIMPATVMSLCGQYLVNPFLNKLTDYYEKKEFKIFDSLLKKLSFVLVLFGIFASTVAFFIGIPVLEFIYAIELDNYTLSLVLIIMSATFYAVTSLFSAALTILKKNIIQLYIYIFTSLLSIILSYFMILYNSIFGAIYAYCISMFVHFTLYLLVYKFIIKREE